MRLRLPEKELIILCGTEMNSFCQLWLACSNKKEGTEITRSLLVKRLVACVKQIPLTADYLWQGKIKHSDEVLLIMESREDLFDEVEEEVTKLHSYDAFVLQAVQISKVSKKAISWLKKELR